MGKNFKGICKVLFDQNYVEMELEDEVRFQLYVDHLKLHQLEIINSKNARQAEPVSNHRYLKKLFKLFIQWRQELDETETNYGDTCM